jgi:hypothetical protein
VEEKIKNKRYIWKRDKTYGNRTPDSHIKETQLFHDQKKLNGLYYVSIYGKPENNRDGSRTIRQSPFKKLNVHFYL